jgi:hypothetical protein
LHWPVNYSYAKRFEFGDDAVAHLAIVDLTDPMSAKRARQDGLPTD